MFPQAGQDQRGQVKRRLHLHVEHQRVLLGGKVLDPAEIGHRRVVDQDVRGTELAGGLGDEELTVLGLGQVRRDGEGGPARCPDLIGGLADGSRERGGAWIRATRGDRHGGAFGGEPPGDLRADAAAGTRDDRDLSVKQAHSWLPVSWRVGRGAASNSRTGFWYK